MRMSAVREGLRARCAAMVECGWTWGEVGKDGLRILDVEGGGMMNGHGESTSSGLYSILVSPSMHQTRFVRPNQLPELKSFYNICLRVCTTQALLDGAA